MTDKFKDTEKGDKQLFWPPKIIRGNSGPGMADQNWRSMQVVCNVFCRRIQAWENIKIVCWNKRGIFHAVLPCASSAPAISEQIANLYLLCRPIIPMSNSHNKSWNLSSHHHHWWVSIAVSHLLTCSSSQIIEVVIWVN